MNEDKFELRLRKRELKHAKILLGIQKKQLAKAKTLESKSWHRTDIKGIEANIKRLNTAIKKIENRIRD